MKKLVHLCCVAAMTLMMISLNDNTPVKAATYDYMVINHIQATASMGRTTGRMTAKTVEGTNVLYLTAKINRATFSDGNKTGLQATGYKSCTSVASGNGLPTSGNTTHTCQGYGHTKSTILSGSF